jgi:hypothetical protein
MPDNQLLDGGPGVRLSKVAHSNMTISFAEIDSYSASIEAERFESIESLASHLTEDYLDEKSKVRSIYTWIAHSISYDQDIYSSSKAINTQTATAVWQNKKAVCEGYANLFIAMCKTVGIESRLVKGYVRDYSDSELMFPNHAWNSVKINGRWQLLDVTWASINNESNVVGNEALSALYQKHKLDYFFLPDPKSLLLTHLPEDPYWQLQSHHVDLETFVKGEVFVAEVMKNPRQVNEKNFEILIDKYEKLDSLDRSIAYLERMERNVNNKVREYGLGIAYYYKAQSIIKGVDRKNAFALQRAKDKARDYYQKSLKYLSELREDDFGFDFSQYLADNVSIKMEMLQ